MKKKLCILALLTVFAVNVHAQNRNAFDYLSDSLVNVLSVATIMQIGDYEYNGDNAVWGAYLEAGKDLALASQYDAGVEYLLFASAHTERADIDLKIYQGRGTGGTVVAKDLAPDASPVARFVPSSSGYYTFELINAGSNNAFVSLVVLKQKRNANFSLRTLAEALDNTLELAQFLANEISFDSEVPANKWTLFGGNISRGGVAGYFNNQLPRGGYLLVGAGENSVTNCDVEVVEQSAVGSSSGKVISANTESVVGLDFAAFQSNPSKYYYNKVINQNSRNSSAFMFGFIMAIK